MFRETWNQSQVESYQRLKKWYLMLPCLTLSIIRYGSRVKWSNPGKGIALSRTPWCSSYWKGRLRVTLDYGRQLYFYYTHKSMKDIKWTCIQHYQNAISNSIFHFVCLFLFTQKWNLKKSLPTIATSILILFIMQFDWNKMYSRVNKKT